MPCSFLNTHISKKDPPSQPPKKKHYVLSSIYARSPSLSREPTTQKKKRTKERRRNRNENKEMDLTQTCSHLFQKCFFFTSLASHSHRILIACCEACVQNQGLTFHRQLLNRECCPKAVNIWHVNSSNFPLRGLAATLVGVFFSTLTSVSSSGGNKTPSIPCTEIRPSV